MEAPGSIVAFITCLIDRPRWKFVIWEIVIYVQDFECALEDRPLVLVFHCG